MMSAVIYDVDFDTRKTWSVWLLVAIKEKNFTRHRSPKNIKISKHTAIFKL